MADLHPLAAGYTLTVTAGVGAASARQVEDETIAAVVQSGFSYTFGPYLVDRSFLVDGGATISVDAFGTSFGNLLATNAGAPVDAVQASKSINPTGDDNALTFTARVAGSPGNSITVEYVDPGADGALSVSVAGPAITVTLAYAEAAITSTAAEVLAAIDAHPQANELVSVAIDASDTGSGDDGSGVVTAIAKTALESGAGTAIGTVETGGLLIDTTNGKLYKNTGTKALPVWVSPDDLHLYGAGVPVDYTDGDPPATGEGTAYPGAIYTDLTNADVYRNDGTRAQPAWVQLGDAA